MVGEWCVGDDEDDIDDRAKEVTSLNIFTSFYHHQHTPPQTPHHSITSQYFLFLVPSINFLLVRREYYFPSGRSSSSFAAVR